MRDRKRQSWPASDLPKPGLKHEGVQKIGLLQGRTHINEVTKSGPLRPELALRVVEDLAYLQTAREFMRKQ